MSRNEPLNENGPLFFIAGLVCLGCFPIIYLTTRPVVWLHMAWTEWLLQALFTMVPLSVTFIILYYSTWHEERPKIRRIASAVLSSCVIFGVDLFVVILLAVGGCLIVGLGRVMGGN